MFLNDFFSTNENLTFIIDGNFLGKLTSLVDSTFKIIRQNSMLNYLWQQLLSSIFSKQNSFVDFLGGIMANFRR